MGERSFEDILDLIGHFGPAQALILFFSCSLEATCALIVYYFMFEGGQPGFYCVHSNSSSANGALNLTLDECPPTGKTCSNITYLDEFTSVVTEWDMICGDAYIPRLLTSLLFVGLLVGAFLGGQLADIYGRKWTLLAAWALMMFVQATSAVAPSWPVYAAVRAVAGVSGGAVATIATVLAVEFVGPKWRPLLSIRFGWRVGNFIIIGLAYLLPQWRLLVVASGLFMFPVFALAIFFMPESSRWLIQKGRYEEASKVLTYVARLNKRAPPDMKLIMELGEEKVNNNYTFLDLFRTKRYAAQTLTLMFGWFVSNTTSYGLQAQISSALVGDIYLNSLIAGSMNVVTVIIGALMMKWMPRRISYAVFMIYPIGAMAAILTLDLTGYMVGREMLRTMLALSSFAVLACSWQVDILYSTEAYPTLVRNIATGAGNIAARVGGILAPQIGLLGVFHPSLPYAIIGAQAIAASILMFVVMPETKGRPLPEGLPPRSWGKGSKTCRYKDTSKEAQIQETKY
ncbi:organic cation transporter protein-like [Lineus longissimus]|uniref:organic cation transporter protein-like n=1 Tax=Lineus longissimus TaxID=88925 RepID=UPI002B4E099B